MPNSVAGMKDLVANRGDFVTQISGDSITAGQGSNNVSGSRVAMKTAAYPTQLTALLNTASIPASCSSFFANCSTTDFAELLTADTRLTTGGTGTGWSLGSSFPTIGGFALGSNDTTQTLIFTVPDTADTADLYFMVYASAGDFGWSVDGGGFTNVTLVNASRGIGKFTISLGANSAGHTIALKGVSPNIFLCGIVARSTVTRRLLVLNQGSCGSTSDALVSVGNGEDWGNNLNAVGAKLTFLAHGFNDQGVRADPTTTMSNFQTAITALRASGSDVVLVQPHPKSDTVAVQNAYLAALQNLAALNNVLLLNMSSTYQTLTGWIAGGSNFDSGDNIHPGSNGAGNHGTRFLEVISAIKAAAA